MNTTRWERLGHSVELELADERDMSREQANALSSLIRGLPLFKEAEGRFVEHHEEDGEVYPARLTLHGIPALPGGDNELRCMVRDALEDWVPRITIMGTGTSLRGRQTPCLVEE